MNQFRQSREGGCPGCRPGGPQAARSQAAGGRCRIAVLAVSLTLLTACTTVGPDFQAPAAPAVTQRPTSAPHLAAELSISDAMLPRAWWRLFRDPALDALQERLLADSPDLRTAALRFAQSRLQQAVVASQSGPHVDAQAAARRQRQSENSAETRLVGAIGGPNRSALIDVLSEPFPLYQAGFDASWELDLWGRVRRSIEGADAGVQAAGALLEQAQLALSAELARTWFQLRLVQRQQYLLDSQLDVASQALALLREQAENGLIAEDEAIAQQSRVAELESAEALLRAREAMLGNQVSLLVGALPGDLDKSLRAWPMLMPLSPDGAAGPEPMPAMPQLALGLPSELARRRPDLRAVEAQLHAATADIGVAVADLYPRIALGASVALQSIEAGRFGEWGSRAWQIGPVLSLPVFDHGRRRATVELRKLQQQQAAVAYQQAVLRAWTEIDDALNDHAAERQRFTALQARLQARQQAWELAWVRREKGLSSDLPVLQAQLAWLQGWADIAESQARLCTGMVSVIKAVGGGG